MNNRVWQAEADSIINNNNPEAKRLVLANVFYKERAMAIKVINEKPHVHAFPLEKVDACASLSKHGKALYRYLCDCRTQKIIVVDDTYEVNDREEATLPLFQALCRAGFLTKAENNNYRFTDYKPYQLNNPINVEVNYVN